jgi:hypothetical protein
MLMARSSPTLYILYYQPFSLTDLLNWRNHMLSYSEKSQVMADFLESIFQPHQPTWDDCQQTLLTFFNTEEQQRILTEARRWPQGQAPAGTLDTEAWAREAVPMLEPLGTSIQQKDEEILLNIVPPSYMGLGLKLRDLPTGPKLQWLFRRWRKP